MISIIFFPTHSEAFRVLHGGGVELWESIHCCSDYREYITSLL
jgi:hypothetical protein